MLMVYFAKVNLGHLDLISGGINLIKIGQSKDIRKRFYQLRYHYDHRIKFLFAISGDRKREADIHRRFQHLQVIGYLARCELFYPVPELLDFLENLRKSEAVDLDWVMTSRYY